MMTSTGNVALPQKFIFFFGDTIHHGGDSTWHYALGCRIVRLLQYRQIWTEFPAGFWPSLPSTLGLRQEKERKPGICNMFFFLEIDTIPNRSSNSITFRKLRPLNNIAADSQNTDSVPWVVWPTNEGIQQLRRGRDENGLALLCRDGYRIKPHCGGHNDRRVSEDFHSLIMVHGSGCVAL